MPGECRRTRGGGRGNAPGTRRACGVAGIATILIWAGACATGGTRFPWPAPGPPAPASRAEVSTANASYQRATSQVLVRRVKRPTRANLDYAAYHANFMNTDPPPEAASMGSAGGAPRVARPFAGALEPASLTGSVARTTLTPDERARPLALAPLVELLASKHVVGADRLDDLAARIRAESWGLAGGPQIVRQLPADLYLHDPGGGRPVELWIRVELAPWFTGFSGRPDEDGDGVPEIYGRVPAPEIGDATAIVAFIRDEYEAKPLTPAEVRGWAHQLASYWYPSYNTDLVPATGDWPAADTESEVARELGGERFPSPTVVMRGKPLGKAVYNVFIVDFGAAAPTAAAAPSARLALPPSKPSADPSGVESIVRAELAAHGGSWTAWMAELAPLHAAFKRRLTAPPREAKAVTGGDGFLFFRPSLAYAVGGDLARQRRERNPIPVIVQFGRMLAEQGVDLLFVPVPTKVEMFPDEVVAPQAKGVSGPRWAGKIVNPFERKLLLELAEQGIETVDLLPAFLAVRTARADDKGGEPLYQKQDTHWTSRGLELAAHLVADRVKRYPWYRGLSAHRRSYTTKDAQFTRHGDLHSRLPESEKAGRAPETLTGHQVLGSAGQPYDDDPDSPIVLLGDSFTGVYQLMDCEHAGVSAHLAKELGYPVDLVMSYGGGPNVRQKLLRRGAGALASKKLVIWMMTARDLHDFWEGWQPLGVKGAGK